MLLHYKYLPPYYCLQQLSKTVVGTVLAEGPQSQNFHFSCKSAKFCISLQGFHFQLNISMAIILLWSSNICVRNMKQASSFVRLQ